MASYDQRNHIVGLEKGLTVIECFDAKNQKLTIADVARKVHLSRAAARRCLLTLAHLGYAEFDGKFFRLTVRSLRLGFAYLSSTPLPQILQLHIEKLSDETHESCAAAILDESEVVYIARATVKRILASGVHIGSTLPAFCTSTGRVLLAALEPSEARSRIKAAPRPALTKYTKTDVDDVLAALDRARRDGYCLVQEELEQGLISLAVPVYNSAGRVVAALNIGAQKQRLDARQLVKQFLPKLLKIQSVVTDLIP